jgi:hypothetical protein
MSTKPDYRAALGVTEVTLHFGFSRHKLNTGSVRLPNEPAVYRAGSYDFRDGYFFNSFGKYPGFPAGGPALRSFEFRQALSGVFPAVDLPAMA